MRISGYPKFQAFDDDGNPLVGGYLYTYKQGTNTLKNTYANISGTVNDNPIELDSRGEASLYLSGSYKFILKDSSNVTVWTQDNIRGADYHNIQYADSDIESAVAAIGSDTVTLLVDQTQALTGDLTIPANIQLWMARDSLITIPNGYVLTINGHLNAGPYQIFADGNADYSGVVIGPNSADKIYPEWFAPNTTPGTTDMTTGLQAAINTGKDRAPVFLSNTYYFNTNLTNHGTAIIGIPGVATLKPGAAVTVTMTLYKPTPTLAASYTPFIPISGFEVDGTATSGAIGIQVGDTGDPGLCYDLSHLVVHTFTGTDGIGVWMAQAQTCTMRFCHVHGCYVNLLVQGVTNIYPTTLTFFKNTFRYASQYGVLVYTGTQLVFENNVYESNYQYGFLAQANVPYVSGQQTTLVMKNDYFENNWMDDAGRASEFSCSIGWGGLAGCTVSSELNNVTFDTGAANPLALRYSYAVNSVARNLRLANQIANCIEVNTSTSQVMFEDMVNYNWASILNNVDSSIYVQGDSLPWVSWSPSYSVDGGGSYGTITTTFAKYKIIGKTVHIRLNFTGTLTGATTTTITLTLPTGLTPTNLIANGCVALDAAAQVAGRIETVSNNITITKLPVGNFTAGAGVGAIASLTFDLQ